MCVCKFEGMYVSVHIQTYACMLACDLLKALFLTSWLETSAWSLRVMPSPMADFIRREREGKTLMGG